jgi:hypothetical protein
MRQQELLQNLQNTKFKDLYRYMKVALSIEECYLFLTIEYIH